MLSFMSNGGLRIVFFYGRLGEVRLGLWLISAPTSAPSSDLNWCGADNLHWLILLNICILYVTRVDTLLNKVYVFGLWRSILVINPWLFLKQEQSIETLDAFLSSNWPLLWHAGERRVLHAGVFFFETDGLKDKTLEHLVVVDGRILLKWALTRLEGEAQIGFIWLWVEYRCQATVDTVTYCVTSWRFFQLPKKDCSMLQLLFCSGVSSKS
jgi:hypothetical protein